MNLLSRCRRLLARPSSSVLLCLAIALGVAAVGQASTSKAAGANVAAGRVVVLGFDGADSRTVARMIGEGELPHLAQLAEQGTFEPLISTNPAESAAGWAAINTGTNPVKNNVPSFIKRDLPNLTPGFAHIETGTRKIEDLDPPGLLGILVRWGGTPLTVGAAVAGLLATLLVLGLLLRVNLLLSAALGLLVGGALGFAAHRARAWVPAEVPDVYMNKVTQPGFWDHAAQAGKRAVVLDAALAFGRPETPGARVLAGLGLPDVRGASNGNWFLYTTDEFADRAGKRSDSNTGITYRVDEKDGKVETFVYGPVDFAGKTEVEKEIAALDAKIQGAKGWQEAQALRDEKRGLDDKLAAYKDSGDAARLKVPLVLERKGGELAITLAGQTQVVGPGEWTDWYRVAFEMNSLVTAHAVTRARVISMADPLVVYVNTLDIDPENPPFWQPVSSPTGFSRDLAGWLGEPYETLGWACLTNQIKDEELPVDVFLEDIQFTMDFRRRLTRAALARDDWDLLFSVFSTTDRVQHMMYRYHDPEHPVHDAAEAERVVDFFGKPTRLADAIPEIYRQMDAVVGEVMEALRPEDTLLLCADHGFTSFRRAVDVNNWLIENGYMTLKQPLTSTRGSILFNVEWSETKAYSLGLGMVYLNLAGREPGGIVAKGDAIPLLHEIGSRMVGEARDPGPDDAPYGEPRQAVVDYAVMSELYSGPVAWDSPDYPCADLQLGFAEYYRTSWSGVSGGIRLVKQEGEIVPGPVFRDNTNNWSGDHASNSPNVVTGTFFSSRKVVVPEGGISVMHLAPTVLDLLGVPRPASMDLEALDRVGS